MNDGYRLVVKDVDGDVSVAFASFLNPNVAEVWKGSYLPSLHEVLRQCVDATP